MGEGAPSCKNGRCWAGGVGEGARRCCCCCCWGENSDEASSLLAINIAEAKELPLDTEAGEGRAPRMEGLIAPVELGEDEDTGLERHSKLPLLLLLLVLGDWEFLAAVVGVLLGSGAFRLLPLVGMTMPLLGFFSKNCSMPMPRCLDECWSRI